MNENRTRLAMAAILGVSAFLCVCTITSGHDWGDDFAGYIMQARSISEWKMPDFLKHNSFTIHNSDFPIGPVSYPWGYPLLLAPIYKFSGLNLYGFKAVNILCFLSFLVCFYLLLSGKRLSKPEASLLVAVFAFNPELLRFLDNILSDIPFLLFSTLSLLLIDRLQDKSEDSTFVQTTWIGIAVFAAYTVRSNGILLLVALAVIQIILFRRARPRSLRTFFAPYLVFAVLWFVFSLVFPGGQGSYLEQYRLLDFTGLQHNLFYYLLIWKDFFAGIPGSNVITALTLCFFCVGFATARTHDTVLKIYFVVTFLALLLYPLPQGLRYLFPILPIFIYLAYQGMLWLAMRIAKKHAAAGKLIIVCCWIVLIAIFLYDSVDASITNIRAGRQHFGPFEPESVEMFDFVKQRTPADSVIIFFKPRLLRMLTGRDAVMVNSCPGLKLGDYVVLDLGDEAAPGVYAEQLSQSDLLKCDLPFRKVFENRRFVAFAITRTYSIRKSEFHQH